MTLCGRDLARCPNLDHLHICIMIKPFKTLSTCHQRRLSGALKG
jgi:hypothetical protein